jgi:hypothetical protein
VEIWVKKTEEIERKGSNKRLWKEKRLGTYLCLENIGRKYGLHLGTGTFP